MPEWLIMNYVCNKYVTVASVCKAGGATSMLVRNLSLSFSVLNGHFPGEPGLAGVY